MNSWPSIKVFERRLEFHTCSGFNKGTLPDPIIGLKCTVISPEVITYYKQIGRTEEEVQKEEDLDGVWIRRRSVME